jgi:hypothetical protein
MTFVRFADGTVGAASGCHDDLVMALAICLRMLRYVNFNKTGSNATQMAINAEYNKTMKGVSGY